ncbi:AbrB family transcriptional regulator [Paenibacillus algorifonticola]|nr:AbrB family transcriptional regulator [Paenibacillus algorifonticola]
MYSRRLVANGDFGGVHEGATSITAGSEGAYWAALFPGIVPFAIACVAAALLAKRIKMPSAYLLGPMIVTAIIHGLGLDAPVLPSGMINAAQLMIGTYVGLLLRPESLKSKVRMTLLAVASGIILLVGAFGLTVLLGKLHPISPATAFLSMVPGGMDQMGIMAKEIHADMAIVSCYQLFRIWFIYFAVPPLLRLIFKRIGGGSGTGTASGTDGHQSLKSH